MPPHLNHKVCGLHHTVRGLHTWQTRSWDNRGKCRLTWITRYVSNITRYVANINLLKKDNYMRYHWQQSCQKLWPNQRETDIKVCVKCKQLFRIDYTVDILASMKLLLTYKCDGNAKLQRCNGRPFARPFLQYTQHTTDTQWVKNTPVPFYNTQHTTDTPWVKKHVIKLLSISLLNIHQFSRLFHQHSSPKICDKTVIEDPTTS